MISTRNRKYNFIFAILLVLYSLILTPLYTYFNSNILYSDTVGVFVLYHILTYFSYLFFWGLFAYILSDLKDKKIKWKPLLSFYVYSVAVHSFSMLVNCLILSFDSFSLYTLLANIFFDVFLSSVSFLIFYIFRNKSTKTQCNVASSVPALFHIINRIIYDVDYGAPSDASDLLVMILYYLSDVIFFALGVIVINVVQKKSISKEQNSSF